MLVPVEPSAHLDGIVAEPLLETADELSRLLADARSLVARTCTIDVRTSQGMETRQRNSCEPRGRQCRSHRHRAVRHELQPRAILGSVAVRVVELARCDVLVA
jgi:hypothetical protein